MPQIEGDAFLVFGECPSVLQNGHRLFPTAKVGKDKGPTCLHKFIKSEKVWFSQSFLMALQCALKFGQRLLVLPLFPAEVGIFVVEIDFQMVEPLITGVPWQILCN